MNYPERKALRLKDYNYNSSGAYFVTICTEQKRCMFSDVHVGNLIDAPNICYSNYGKIVDQYINSLPVKFGISVDKYVIMPNHVHMIIGISDSGNAPLQTKRSLISKAIGYLKMNVTRDCRQLTPNIEIWQRSFYDHIIRNEDDYSKIWNYIDTNPQRWTEDRYFIE